MFTTEIIGAWFSVFLTLGILSYLYDDNPFYKAAEHIFVGVSAGYWASVYFWTQVQPNLFGRLWPRLEETAEAGFFHQMWYGIYNMLGFINSGIFPEGGIEGHREIRLIYIIPLILGIFMLMRLIPKVGWLARWAIAYIVGMAAGLRFYGFLNSDVMEQIKSSTINFSGDWIVLINGIIMVVGTLTGLLYFFFSKEHTGVFGKLSKIGIYFLMISFGASFGFAVMGRISLLIGRFNDLIVYSGVEYHNATYWILGVMIVLLFIWAFTGKNKGDNATA
ncbi:MAG: hypothetical protein ACE5D7_08130 [Fidelibacterota bacterium]